MYFNRCKKSHEFEMVKLTFMYYLSYFNRGTHCLLKREFLYNYRYQLFFFNQLNRGIVFWERICQTQLGILNLNLKSKMQISYDILRSSATSLTPLNLTKPNWFPILSLLAGIKTSPTNQVVPKENPHQARLHHTTWKI